MLQLIPPATIQMETVETPPSAPMPSPQLPVQFIHGINLDASPTARELE